MTMAGNTQQVTIHAANMLVAQSIKLTPEHRAILVAKADRFREITGTTEKTNMNVPVLDGTTVIGHMTYML